MEEGVWLPPAGPSREHVLPVQVDARRPASCPGSACARGRGHACVQGAEPDATVRQAAVGGHRSLISLGEGPLAVHLELCNNAVWKGRASFSGVVTVFILQWSVGNKNGGRDETHVENWRYRRPDWNSRVRARAEFCRGGRRHNRATDSGYGPSQCRMQVLQKRLQ